AVPAPIPLPDFWGLPPVLEQAPSRVITAVAAAMAANLRGVRRVAADGRLRAHFIAILYFSSRGCLLKRLRSWGDFSIRGTGGESVVSDSTSWWALASSAAFRCSFMR